MTHIVFGYSAASSLKQALQDLQISDDILRLGDDLSIGPVSDVTGPERHQWFMDFYAFENDAIAQSFWQEQISFWAGIERVSRPVTIWVSFRSSFEQCAFAETLQRLHGEQVFDLIDVTQHQFEMHKSYLGPIVTGILNPGQLKQAFQFKRQSSVAEWSALLAVWQQIKLENAELRVVEDLKIRSVTADYFDNYLLKQVTSQWRKGARIVGHALSEVRESGHFVGDLYLFDRLLELTDQGKVEMVGEGSMRMTEFKLPNPSS